MVCKKCGGEFEPVKGLKSYCSLQCRNSRLWSDDDKKKKSLMVSISYNKTDLIYKQCEMCSSLFIVRDNKRGNERRFCGRKCSSRSSARIAGLSSARHRVIRSKNEILFYELCNQKFENVDHNQPIFNGWDADIIIHDIKIAILWNGKWHYETITKNHSLKQVQVRDELKVQEIKKCGYTPYIIKDMGKYNESFVKEEFQKFMWSREVANPSGS